MGDPIEWHPARILRGRAPDSAPDSASAPAPAPAPASRDYSPFALLILNQPLRDIATLKTLWKNSSLTVAADGGANRLLEVCQTEPDTTNTFDNLDVIIGDLDSLTPTARDHFTTRGAQPTRIIHEPDQSSTDFSKAVRHIRSRARAARALDIVAMGGLGGRVDQGLSQLHHLHLFQADARYADGRVYLVSGESLTFVLKRGRHSIHVRGDGDGDNVFDKYVGVVPVREPSVISTRGLEWDVRDWETELGGVVSTSNHVLPETRVVEVETTKDVLFTIALKQR